MKKVFYKLGMLAIAGLSVFGFASCNNDDETNEASIVFYQNQEEAEANYEAGLKVLYIYFDGKLAGTMAGNIYVIGKDAADCGMEGLVTVTKDLGDFKKKSYLYKVIDEDDIVWFEGSVELEAGTCTLMELLYE